MNKSELVDALSAKSGQTKKLCNEMLDSLLEVVAETINGGEKITVVGFGSMEAIEVKGRDGRNPRTGEAISIPPSRKAKFSTGKALKDTLNSR